MQPTILTGLAAALHDLFTVVWVGGLVVFSITVFPAMREVLDGKEARRMMQAILRRQRVWVFICIVGLFITGVIQARAVPGFHGLLKFDTTYSLLTSIKHLLMAVMTIIAIFRSVVFMKKAKANSPSSEHNGMPLIVLNAVLGVIVLLLSGLMTVFS